MINKFRQYLQSYHSPHKNYIFALLIQQCIKIDNRINQTECFLTRFNLRFFFRLYLYCIGFGRAKLFCFKMFCCLFRVISFMAVGIFDFFFCWFFPPYWIIIPELRCMKPLTKKERSFGFG